MALAPMTRITLGDALTRVLILADKAYQLSPDRDDEVALAHLEGVAEALQRVRDKNMTDAAIAANCMDLNKAKRPINIDPEADADALTLALEFREVRNNMPVTPTFECTLCDDTGIERYVNRRGQRVATGRVCRQCGDAPTDITQVRLSTTGRIVRPHTVLLPSEIEELRQIAQDGPTPTIRTNARDVLRTIPVAAVPQTSDAIRRAEEEVLRQGATDGMTMMVQLSDGGMRRTRPGDVLTDHMRSWLHERRADGPPARAREVIQAILDQEPARPVTGRSARPVTTRTVGGSRIALDQNGNVVRVDVAEPVVEDIPTAAEPERPPQGSPKESWERRDIHYVKIGTSSDEHGVEIIRPGDVLNQRIRDTLNRSLNSMRSSSARGRARGEHAHRTAIIVRILREDVDLDTPF